MGWNISNDEWDAPAATKGHEMSIHKPVDSFETGKDFGANDDLSPAKNGDTCRICNKEGHYARECPDKENRPSGCFNCGQEGHNKAECPNPRVFKGSCRICTEEGHPAAICPNKPPELCLNCAEPGHKAAECKNRRKMNFDNVETMEAEAAWRALEKADEERDMEEVRNMIKVYVKAVSDTTWAQLEASFRAHDFNTHLIALKKDLCGTFTNVDLQGNTGCEFTVGFYWSFKLTRKIMKYMWPKSPEENLERLKNCGETVASHIPKCLRCNEMGHISKDCSQERVELDRPTIKCVNCEEQGHRARDCPKPRKDQFACRNCGGSDHKAADCTEPRSAANVECKHCGNMGHFVRDCPDKPKETCRNCGEEGHRSKECENPPNPALMTCRNCDEKGHMAKECPKPRDYSRVTCQNCGEKGHTKVRCKAPPKEEENTGFGDSGFGEAGGAASGFASGAGDFDSAAAGDGECDKPTDSAAVAQPVSTSDWDTGNNSTSEW